MAKIDKISNETTIIIHRRLGCYTTIEQVETTELAEHNIHFSDLACRNSKEYMGTNKLIIIPTILRQVSSGFIETSSEGMIS
jgi:hypothetical protein